MPQRDPGVDLDGLGDFRPRLLVLAQRLVGEGPPDVGMGGVHRAGFAIQEFLEGDERLVRLLGIEVGAVRVLWGFERGGDAVGVGRRATVWGAISRFGAVGRGDVMAMAARAALG